MSDDDKVRERVIREDKWGKLIEIYDDPEFSDLYRSPRIFPGWYMIPLAVAALVFWIGLAALFGWL